MADTGMELWVKIDKPGGGEQVIGLLGRFRVIHMYASGYVYPAGTPRVPNYLYTIYRYMLYVDC
jgi:hypothetical protein